MSKFPLKNAVIYAASFLLAAVFLYVAFRGVELGSILELLKNASLLWIAVFILVQMSAHYFRAVRWKLILRSLHPNISVNHLLGAVLIGYGVNNVIPRLGEAARAIVVGKLENISKTTVLGTIVVERIIDMIVFAGAVLLSAWIYEGDLYQAVPWLPTVILFGTMLFVAAVIMLVLLIRLREKFGGWLVRIVEKISPKLSVRLEHLFHKLITGFGSLRGASTYFWTVVTSLLIMAGYGFVSYAAFFILGMEQIMPITLSMGWVVMSIGSIGVMIPTPGGTGSYHIITKEILMGLYGFAGPISLAYATINHGLSYLMHFLAGALYLFVFRRKYSQLQKTNILEMQDEEKSGSADPNS